MVTPSKILLAAVVLICGFLVFVALQSPNFRISRSERIHAPPATLFELVNDQHKFNTWNPWMGLDPQVKQTYEGPASGVGASYSWDGNEQVGAGHSAVIESTPNSSVRMRLEYDKPYKAMNTAEFTFVPEGDDTVVTWAISGQNTFFTRLVCDLFVNMDKVVGGMFEKGLAQLKSMAEVAPPKQPAEVTPPQK